MKRVKDDTGVGATKDLDLRVSVGTLIRVLFKHPDSGKQVLALERTATLYKNGDGKEVIVRAKPFGGGARILRPDIMRDRIGDFHYDSERSRQEQDFRIMVNAGSWEKVKELCREYDQQEGEVFEKEPQRELTEEFYDSLKFNLKKEDYLSNPKGIIIKDQIVATGNIHAPGVMTARVYFLYEAQIIEPKVIQLMLNNSLSISNKDLRKMAYDDAANGGKGRANAILALDLSEVQEAYSPIPPERLDEPVYLEGHRLEGNVPMVL